MTSPSPPSRMATEPRVNPVYKFWFYKTYFDTITVFPGFPLIWGVRIACNTPVCVSRRAKLRETPRYIGKCCMYPAWALFGTFARACYTQPLPPILMGKGYRDSLKVGFVCPASSQSGRDRAQRQWQCGDGKM